MILGDVVELKDIDFSPNGCNSAIADILEKIKQLEAIWIVHGDERTMSLRELAGVFCMDFTTLYRWKWDIINTSPQLLGVYESSQIIERKRLGAHQRFFYLLIWVLRDKDLLGYRPLSHQEISSFQESRLEATEANLLEAGLLGEVIEFSSREVKMLKDLHGLFESLRLAVTANTAIFCVYTFVLSSLSFLTFLMMLAGDVATASIIFA